MLAANSLKQIQKDINFVQRNWVHVLFFNLLGYQNLKRITMNTQFLSTKLSTTWYYVSSLQFQTNAEIQEWVHENYHPNFPLFAKINVLDDNVPEAWRYLIGMSLFMVIFRQ